MWIKGQGEKLQSVLQSMFGQPIDGAPVVGVLKDGAWTMAQSRDEQPLRVWIDEPLGYGGQAAVAKGFLDDGAHTPVALRMEFFAEEDMTDPRRVAMLRASDLSVTQPEKYPALLPVKQTFVTQLPTGLPVCSGTFVICDVAELCQPLGAWLREHRIGAVEAVRLWLPVAVTMDRLFKEYGWVHRDIDEGNVLVGHDGKLRLADLGIVTIVGPEMTHKSTALIGKQASLPPEGRQARAFNDRGCFEVRPSYDAWQLGRLLLIMLTGGRADDTLIGDPTLIGAGWSQVPGNELGDVVRGLLATDPKQRMELGTAIEHLRRWVSSAAGSRGSRLATIPPGPVEPIRRTAPALPPNPPGSKVVAAVAVAAFFVGALSIGAAWLLWGRDGSPVAVATVTVPAPSSGTPTAISSSPSPEPTTQTPSPTPTPAPTVMLDVVGEDLDTARTLLEEAGLPDPNVSEVVDWSRKPGTVLAQSPKPESTFEGRIVLDVVAPQKTTYLSEISPVGYGGGLPGGIAGGGNGVGSVEIGGKEYRNSVALGFFPGYWSSGVKYNLGKDWQRFSVVFGIADDALDEACTMHFRIRLDEGSGNSRYLADVTLPFGARRRLDLKDVSGGLRLALSAKPECPNGRDPQMYAAFGNARLFRSPS